MSRPKSTDEPEDGAPIEITQRFDIGEIHACITVSGDELEPVVEQARNVKTEIEDQLATGSRQNGHSYNGP